MPESHDKLYCPIRQQNCKIVAIKHEAFQSLNQFQIQLKTTSIFICKVNNLNLPVKQYLAARFQPFHFC